MPPQLQQFRLATVEQLDHRVAALFDKHVARVTQDCMDRPGDKHARKVTLTFSVVPVPDPDSGECEHVMVEVEAKSRMPDHRSPAYPMDVSKAGLRFNSADPKHLHATATADDNGND